MTARSHGAGLVTSLAAALVFLFLAAPAAVASRADPREEIKKAADSKSGGGFFGPGFDMPGFGFPPGFGSGIVGGGYGGGYSGPGGGYSRNGIFRPTVVCKEKGPCYKKKLTCPAKCFTSYSSSGKNYGGGGGGGGCTMDCKKKCTAYC